MFRIMIVVLDPGTGKEMALTMAHGPRAIARGLMNTFNDDPFWDQRHIGACAAILADYTAEEVTLDAVNAVLRAADLVAVAA